MPIVPPSALLTPLQHRRYLADEPGGSGIKPATLLPKYKAVRAADETGKPVSMVFCTTQAAAYLEMLDVIMVDPYPVPGSR